MLGLRAILLCGRKDSRALRELQRHGIEPHCIYPARDEAMPPRGCYVAHTQALQLAKEQGWLPCVIFEDNVIVSPDYDTATLRSALHYALSLNPTLVHLSRFPFSDIDNVVGWRLHRRTAHDNVLALHSNALTGLSAYVATHRTLELWPAWRDRSIDCEFGSWPDRYAVQPMPFMRAGVKTKNHWTVGGHMQGKPTPMRDWMFPLIPFYCRHFQYLDNWSTVSFIVGAIVTTVVLWLVLRRSIAN